MRNHASSDWKIVDNINNMVFAKDFFEMIDEKAQSEVTLEQIKKPLKLLGLETNLSFMAIAF